MVTIRSVNEIISNLIDFFRLAQPTLDTKPGTVARDLFIEGPSSQLSLLYDELQGVSSKQSLRLSIGTDLDKLGTNFGLVRKQSTPSTGVSLLTFASLNATVNVNAGAPVYTAGGLGFTVINGISLVPSNINTYRSTATKFSAQLAYVGITDQYAVEVTVTASAPGSAGNIGQYSLSQVNIGGISNVTNINTFAGGTDQETDAAFRNRILSTFSGSSVGTSLGYLNAALSVTGVEDATVIGPGNPLMTRDGTVVDDINGTLTIVQEGSGGKVDVVVLGTIDVANTDTFIYQDKSNQNNPANPLNNFVLGQIASNANMSIAQKRVTDIAAGQVPTQPVDSLTQVTGSKSGSNFIPYTVDGYGRGSGNYQLIKDTGVYGGSCFGFDTFAWTSDQIVYQEDLIKGQTNGQDPTTFTGLTQITGVQQQLSVTNENSTVGTDRSLITLLHTPATNVTRVFDVNTGQRYVITNQNYDGTTPYNNTGRIQISGNTLPSPSDVLQVDYTWVLNYDPFSDFDGLVDTNNPRESNNSVDWGYSSDILNEFVEFTASPGNNFYTGSTSHPVNTIITANTFVQVDGYVQTVTSGTFVNRLSVVLSNLAVATATVDSVTWDNSNAQLYNTAQNNGSFSNVAVIVGINVLNDTTIILPSDTVAQAGDAVTAYINSTNVFQSATAQGSSNGSVVTIPSSLMNTTADRLILRVTYIASVSNLFSSVITSLPTSRIGNGFIVDDNNGFNNFSIVNVSRRENQIIQLNLSNQFYIELDLDYADYTLTPDDVVAVIRLADGLELWNADNEGQVVQAIDGNYQLIFSGYNTPAASQSVLVIYYAPDTTGFQPFSFNNEIIKTRVDTLTVDPITNSFVVPLVSFTAQASGLSFEVVDQNADIVHFTVTDGYLVVASPTTALISSASQVFSSLPDLTNKRIKITGATTPNNDGYFDISSYNIGTNYITITSSLSKITKDQVSIIRILDGQELWSYSGTIDQTNNRLLIPQTPNAVAGNEVFTMFFNYQNLRKSPTRIIGTTQDQTVNTGIITVAGTSIALAQNVIFTATTAGLQQNLQSALAQVLGLSSTATIPSNVRIAKIVSLQQVDTYTPGSSVVLETLVNYDVIGTAIANNLYYADSMLPNSTLSGLEFVLPSTATNTATANLPAIGDQLQVTFYYTIDNDYENLQYTRIGTLYTNKKFALINQIYTSSGFGSSQTTKFTATSFTQPSVGARYTVFYNYLAPQQNERILIQYNYNQLITTATFTIEGVRPINADVLVRAAKLVLVNLTMNIVVDPTYVSAGTSQTVIQNVYNAMSAALSPTTMGTTISQISLINTAQGIAGCDRARVLIFNVNGQPGQELTLTANQDQYFQPNLITINTESL